MSYDTKIVREVADYLREIHGYYFLSICDTTNHRTVRGHKLQKQEIVERKINSCFYLNMST